MDGDKFKKKIKLQKISRVLKDNLKKRKTFQKKIKNK
tara:strand:+ start:290 stop:400 length:111 start_codon:yes stop_codon:yes gene_type:complete